MTDETPTINIEGHTTTNKPRRPWIAALLTLPTIGLGHLYAGNPKRGVILFAIRESLEVVFNIFIIVVPNIISVLIAMIGGLAFVVFCVVDAASLAKRKKESYILAKYNRWYVYVGCLVILYLVSTLLSAGVKANLIQDYRIPAGSMRPTFEIGDRILVNKFIYGIKIPFFRYTLIPISEPKRGDIVVLIYPEDRSKVFVKRVIGVSGDTIEIINKKIYLNGQPYSDPYGIYTDDFIIPGSIQPRDNFGPITVRPDTIFVMGDNRDQSYDSRFWGTVGLEDVMGKVFMIYWSSGPDKQSRIRWERIGQSPY